MANENFTQFTAGATPVATDYAVGYLTGGASGAERRWLFSQILAYIVANLPSGLSIAVDEVSINSTDETVVVTFAVPYGASPSAIWAQVSMPNSSGANVYATLIENTVSATGCTFSIPPPGVSGMKLKCFSFA